MGHSEPEIKAFLKARRAALDPAEVGLPEGVVRRRVRGLRREEVAQRAGISVDYYTRIEQGRAPAVSDSVVDGLARALRLTPSEHTYLRNITLPRRHGHASADPRPRVRPEVLRLLEAMDGRIPAFVFGPGMDVLAWNRLGGRIGVDFAALPEDERNGALLIFLDPRTRELHPNWSEVADDTVAGLRAEIGRTPANARLCQIIHELRERSDEFRRRWEAQAVQERMRGTKRYRHPEVGDLVVTYEALVLPADPGQVLCTYTAEKGSASEKALRALAAGLDAEAGLEAGARV
ncbi:helix-turn-helix transcriptional regulator [Streptomyces botrytidirepellens]|uniref:XRE family transcriptional regulator n=1 Tax=Streptomyces botrytidirepellens TaxID=2486417 RepID=A0A3M8V2U0_9ACTN|nr:helix-turn-helix transcriptional regulator [Streptomyces botrytidirepellens]RNG11828.1 XRE family transcriptional regulator [Streptomyces botrytidirepellens]